MGTKEAVSKTTISIFEGLCLPLFCFDNFQHEQKTCFTLWNNMRSLLSWWKQGMRQSTEKEMSNIPEELYKVYFHCKMTKSWDDLHCWKNRQHGTLKNNSILRTDLFLQFLKASQRLCWEVVCICGCLSVLTQEMYTSDFIFDLEALHYPTAC